MNMQPHQLIEQGVQQAEIGNLEAAKSSFQTALNIYRQIQDREWEGKTLGYLGNVYASMNLFVTAIDYYRQSLAIATEINDPQMVMITQQNLARVLFEQGRQQIRVRAYQTALENLQDALNIYHQIHDREWEGWTIFWQGIVYFSCVDYGKSFDCYQQTLAIARKINNQQMEEFARTALADLERENNPQQIKAHQLFEQGFQQLNLGDLSSAQKSLEQALVIYRQLKNPAQEARVLANLGAICNYVGKFSQAIEYLQQALKFVEEAQDYYLMAGCFGNLGVAYRNLGDYARSIEFGKKCLTIQQRNQDLSGQLGALEIIGISYQYLGEYDEAIKYHLRCLEIGHQLQDPGTIAKILGNLGIVYDAKRDYNQAINYQQQSLEISRQIQDPRGEGRSLGNLASIYCEFRNYTQAIEYYLQYLDLARKTQDRQGEGSAVSGLGLVYYFQGNYLEAEKYTQQSLGIAREIQNLDAEGQDLHQLGGILLKQSQFTAAEKILYLGIQAREGIRQRLANNDAYKVSVFERQSSTYSLLQKALLAQNKFTDALEISERGRARAFVELLASRLSSNQIAQATIEPPNFEQIQKIAVAHNTTIIEYALIGDYFTLEDGLQFRESELYIWVVKPTGELFFRGQELKSLWEVQNTSLAELVFSTREAMGVGGRDAIRRKVSNNGKEHLQQLYQFLIAPIADLLPEDANTRVTFIPQSYLFLVPFPALQDESGKYLIEKHTILTAPSIQVLDLTQQKRTQVEAAALKDVLILGNPTMPSVAPSIGELPKKLPQLPGAEAEAKAIASVFQSQPIIGASATKAFVVQQMVSSRIIHLATHGLLDNTRGLSSAIALAPADSDNGLLTAEEIFDLQLNAQLVVLSACDTGRGRLTGDGVIGLSRSFISAGVSSIIVSLWSIPDAPTALLMKQFYENLEQYDKAQALRQAMLKTMEQAPHPRNWAAFTLIGEAE
ncbi:MAG: CHAT domain-containing protein [Nostoc sp. ZfuVER08]|nr:CHAT domain-containing protein [Nostoc sp. ZfuVER08]